MAANSPCWAAPGGVRYARSTATAFSVGEDLDVGRADSRHLSFGKRIHTCVGASLARSEGQIAFATLLRRLPDLALAVAPGDVTCRPGGIFLRGLAELPVTF